MARAAIFSFWWVSSCSDNLSSMYVVSLISLSLFWRWARKDCVCSGDRWSAGPDRVGPVAPPTPALSPLRGEGEGNSAGGWAKANSRSGRGGGGGFFWRRGCFFGGV